MPKKLGLALFLSAFSMLFAQVAQASDKPYQLYNSGNSYYLKTEPTWVPISTSVFVLIPTYKADELLKLEQSAGQWQLSPISLGAFNNANPSVVSDSSLISSDVNGDNNTDLTLSIDGQTLQLVATGNESYEVNLAPDIQLLANQSTPEDTPIRLLIPISDLNTATQDLAINVTSSNSSLVTNDNISFEVQGEQIEVDITPNDNQFGSSTISVQASDGLLSETMSFSLAVTPVNDTPVLSFASDIAFNEDTPKSVAVTVSDLEQSLSSISLEAISNNATVLPSGNIAVNKTAHGFTLTLTPAPNQFGPVLLTLNANDGVGTSETSMLVDVRPVNDAPVVSAISDITIDEDGIATVQYQVTDVDTPYSDLNVSFASTNTALVSSADIQTNRIGTNNALVLSPKPDAFGVATVTMTVSDGALTGQSQFALTVNAVNDQPVISEIDDVYLLWNDPDNIIMEVDSTMQVISSETVSLSQDTVTRRIPFTVTDVDSALSDVDVNVSVAFEPTLFDDFFVSGSVGSTGPILSPLNLSIEGTGKDRELVMSPNVRNIGTALVTITATNLTEPSTLEQTIQSFSVIVAPDTAPEISNIDDVAIDQGNTASVSFTASDQHTPVELLSVVVESSNDQLLPMSNVVLDGGAGDYTLQLDPVDGQTGFSEVTVKVTDGIIYGRETFVFTVGDVNFAENAPAPAPYELPDVTTSIVGTVPGSFRVDEGGAATYDIPFELPSGIAGVTPSLGVAYSSNSGAGTLGIGWNITGLSSVERCRATQEQDGFDGKLDLVESRLCLDGQKLILVSGEYGEAGSEYRTEIDMGTKITLGGEINSSLNPEITVYRPDGSISVYGGTANSSVTSGDATVTWYLRSISDNYAQSENEIVFTYAVLDDAKGNIERVISEVTYSGHAVKFDYSGKAKTTPSMGYSLGNHYQSTVLLNSVTVKNNKNRVRKYSFAYDTDLLSKADTLTHVTLCGTNDTDCYRATEFSWNPQNSPSVSVNKSYTLAERPIVAPTPVDIDGDTKADIVYLKQDEGNPTNYNAYYRLNTGRGSFAAEESLFFLTSNDTGIPRLYPADIDGDGNVELVFTSGNNSGVNWKYYDLEDSVIRRVKQCDALFEHEQEHYRDANGSAASCNWVNTESRIFDLGLAATAEEYDPNHTSVNVSFQDLDADAYPDMLYVRDARLRHRMNKRKNATTGEVEFADAYTYPIDDFDLNNIPEDGQEYISTWIDYIGENVSAADFDGDGKSEFLIKIIDRFSTTQNQSDSNCDVVENAVGDVIPLDDACPRLETIGYVNDGRIVRDAFNFDHRITIDDVRVSDINGDGLADVYVVRNGNDNQQVVYQLNRGMGTFAPAEVFALTLGGRSDYEASTSEAFVDINRDRLADFVYFNKDKAEWRYAPQRIVNGVRSFDTDLRIGSSLTQFYEEDHDFVFLTDWDGDGELGRGLIQTYRENNDRRVLFTYQDNIENNAPLRMGSIDNGFGVVTDIEYAPMSDASVYQKGTGANEQQWGACEINSGQDYCSPVFDLISTQYVVKRVTSDAPSTANAQDTLSVEYFYQGMRAQSGGRGVLGFERVFTFDVDRQITTETVYHQAFPYTGMPKETIQYLGSWHNDVADHELLSHAVNNYDHLLLNGGTTVYPFIESSIEQTYSVDQLPSDSNTQHTTQLKLVTETTNEYRAFGTHNSPVNGNYGNHVNLMSVKVEQRSAVASSSWIKRTTTSNIYNDDNVEKWWLGRVSRTDVQHERQEGAGLTTINRSSAFEYDEQTGVLDTEIVSPDDPKTKLTTKYCFDTFGNIEATHTFSSHLSLSGCPLTAAVDFTDDSEAVYRFSGADYDDERRYVKTTFNAYFDEQRVLEFNEFGAPAKVVNELGIETQFAFDSMGRVVASANQSGTTTYTQKGYAGELDEPTIQGLDYYFVEKQGGRGKALQFAYYDVVGRQVASAKQGLLGSYIVAMTAYDKYGRQVSTTVPHFNGHTRHQQYTQYDKFDRVMSMTVENSDNSETKSTYSYASDGLSTTVLEESNYGFYAVSNEKTQHFNAVGELISAEDTQGSVQFKYDAMANLIEAHGVKGDVVVTEFDHYGRKTAMSDPDKGSWEYDYNAAGELISQTNANNDKTVYFRDSLGRTTKRQVHTSSGIETSSYAYRELGGEIGPLLISEKLDDILHGSKFYAYDNFGRPTRVETIIDGESYVQFTTYDQYSRVFQQFDASLATLPGCGDGANINEGSCQGVRNHYNAYGYLYKQEEAKYSNAPDYYQAKVTYKHIKQTDALGNVVSEDINVVAGQALYSTSRTFDEVSGLNLSVITKQNQSDALYQSIFFKFDGFGNLRERDNLGSGYKQSFGYDEAFRLTSSTHDSGSFGVADVNLTYDTNGNILTKSDVESGEQYQYGQKHSDCAIKAGPHALTKVGSRQFCYDKNGNMVQERDGNSISRSLNYYHFDKVSRVTGNGGVTEFFYNTNRSRYKRITTKDGKTTTTHYIGNVEMVKTGDNVEYRRYIPGGMQTTYQLTGVVQTNYLLKDHLGSLDTIVTNDGKVRSKVYFDPWGKRIDIASEHWNTDAQAGSLPSFSAVTNITDRGFTGHEHVEHADIIHMNGRIYDPTLGRFLQADPHIQAPNNTQSYNRYSYVLNNPLSYTDPSGYFFKKLFKAIGGNKFLSTIISIGLNFIPGCQAWCSAAFNAAITYAVTGSLKGALIGAFVGAISPGGFNPGAFLARAAIGGFAAKIQGGKFGHGFIAAGAGGAASGIGNAGLSIIASAVIGGTVSKITGGKFANGAVSAAFAAAVAAAGDKAFNSREGEHEPTLADLTDEQKADIRERLAEINKSANTNVADDELGVAFYLDDATASLRDDYGIEFGANILSVDGGVGFSIVTTEFYTNAIGIPYIEGALARWHNHPGGTSLSGPDFMNAAQFGIDSYVSVGGGSIHRFNYSLLNYHQNAAATAFFGQGYNTLDKLEPKLDRWLEEQSAFHRNKYISVH